MLSSRRKPLSSSFTSSESSDNSYIPTTRKRSPVALHQLTVHDLDQTNSRDSNQLPLRQREPFRIPRPILTTPHPSIHVPIDDSRRIPSRRPAYVEAFSTSPNLTSRAHLSEGPFYQIALPPTPPPLPIQYQIVPIHFRQPSPKSNRRYKRRKRYFQEKTPGLCATLCSGGFGTVAVLIYLIFCLALPTTKLVLGIVHIQDCPAEKNIPLYMIISGSSGIGIILFLLLSSTCTHCRSSITARKSTHQIMIFTIAFARGMQGLIAIFLFIWFFFGNVWVFGARYRVQTNNPNYDNNNYCHPVLYWFAFYVLIFTYVCAILMCFIRFVGNFFFCRACDMWKRAFS